MKISTAKTPEAAQAFLNQLRGQTATSHKRLESLPLSEAIVKPDITKEQYANYLQAMLAVHRDVEANVYPLLRGIVNDIDERQKAHTIINDLSTVGQTPNVETIIPVTEGVDNMSVPFALGIAYVLEGSTLGGRVILKNIQPALGLTEENGASYFAGYKERTGSAWKSFLETLTTYPENEEVEQEIIAGACHGFDAIYKHMSASPAR